MTIITELPAAEPELAKIDVVTILRDAKSRLEEAGWCRHAAIDPEGHICIAQALFNGPVWPVVVTHPSAEMAGRLLARLVHVPYEKLPMWNDAPGRTVDEVYALLDEAIAVS